MTPEFATFRELVDAVNSVEEKVTGQQVAVEKRLGRIEKAIIVVALLALLHPALSPHVLPLLQGGFITTHQVLTTF